MFHLELVWDQHDDDDAGNPIRWWGKEIRNRKLSGLDRIFAVAKPGRPVLHLDGGFVFNSRRVFIFAIIRCWRLEWLGWWESVPVKSRESGSRLGSLLLSPPIWRGLPSQMGDYDDDDKNLFHSDPEEPWSCARHSVPAPNLQFDEVFHLRQWRRSLPIGKSGSCQSMLSRIVAVITIGPSGWFGLYLRLIFGMNMMRKYVDLIQPGNQEDVTDCYLGL